MSGGKGGSQSTRTEIPEWAESAMKENLDRAAQFARQEPSTYYGPQVAAFNPQQIAAMDSVNQAAGMYGLSSPGGSVADSLPTATDFGGGLMGYETGSLFDQARAEYAGRNPVQAAARDAMFDQYGGGTAGQGFANLAGAPAPTPPAGQAPWWTVPRSPFGGNPTVGGDNPFAEFYGDYRQ